MRRRLNRDCVEAAGSVIADAAGCSWRRTKITSSSRQMQQLTAVMKRDVAVACLLFCISMCFRCLVVDFDVHEYQLDSLSDAAIAKRVHVLFCGGFNVEEIIISTAYAALTGFLRCIGKQLTIYCPHTCDFVTVCLMRDWIGKAHFHSRGRSLIALQESTTKKGEVFELVAGVSENRLACRCSRNELNRGVK